MLKKLHVENAQQEKAGCETQIDQVGHTSPQNFFALQVSLLVITRSKFLTC